MLIVSLEPINHIAQSCASYLEASLYYPDFQTYSLGECKLKWEVDTKNSDVLIVAQMYHDFSDSLLKLLILIDAMQNQGVGKIIIFVPYLSYMRQDKLTALCSAVGAKIVAQIMSANIDVLITLDIHSNIAASYMKCPLLSISSYDLFKNMLSQYSKSTLLVAPDSGASARVQNAAEQLGMDYIVLHKQRLQDRQCEIFMETQAANGRDCIIIDDILDSGNTIKAAAQKLRQSGARSVHAFVTHRILDTVANYKAADLYLESLVSALNLDRSGLITNSAVDVARVTLDALKEYLRLS
jgi:ribose-phosphate pyrophosphokinase